MVSVVIPPEVVDCVVLDAAFGGDALPAVVSVLLLVVVSVWLDAVLLGAVVSVLFVVVSVRLVELLLAGGGASVVLLTVVLDDDVEAGRSQPASVSPVAIAAMANQSADAR